MQTDSGVADWFLSPSSANWGPGYNQESIGTTNQGLGLTTADFDNIEGDDLIFAWVNNLSGENKIQYWVEWNAQYRNHV